MAVISLHLNPKKLRTAAKIGITQLAGLLPCAAVILLTALLVCVTKSVAAAQPLAVAAYAAGALFAGRFAAKMRGRHGLAEGLKAAFVFWLITSAIAAAAALAMSSPEHLPLYLLSRFAVAHLCGAAGGVIGVNS